MRPIPPARPEGAESRGGQICPTLTAGEPEIYVIEDIQNLKEDI